MESENRFVIISRGRNSWYKHSTRELGGDSTVLYGTTVVDKELYTFLKAHAQ